jgi:hypothetical protein
MSEAKYDKQPGFPETEPRWFLITGSNFAKCYKSARKFSGLESPTSHGVLEEKILFSKG